MLLFGRKITGRQARDWGLITEVYPDVTFEQDIENRLKEIAELPKQVIQQESIPVGCVSPAFPIPGGGDLDRESPDRDR